MLKILGIDPGTRHLGYCLVEYDNGNVHVAKRGTLGLKGKIIWSRQIIPLCRQLFDAVACWPDVVAIEQINWYGKRKGVLALAHLAGALGGLYSVAPLGVWYFVPKDVKFESALNRRAGWNEHETDALSLCRLVARKVAPRGKDNQPVVAHKTPSPKRTR